jgi:hypothetical protein
MKMPMRDGRMPQHDDISARIKIHCQVSDAHTRSITLEHATIYADGWACWAEDDHVRVGYVQAGRCCDTPEVSRV